MTPQQLIVKWKQANLIERSAAQQHFLDLCELLQQPKPAEADPDGTHYTFERGAHKTDGGEGWADVWMQGHFGWAYKGKHKDLVAANRQLLQYREALDNPPLNYAVLRGPGAKHVNPPNVANSAGLVVNNEVTPASR